MFQYELLLESRRTPELRPHAEALHRTYREETGRALSALGIEDRGTTLLVFTALDRLVFSQSTLGDTDDTTLALTRLRELLARLATSSS